MPVTYGMLPAETTTTMSLDSFKDIVFKLISVAIYIISYHNIIIIFCSFSFSMGIYIVLVFHIIYVSFALLYCMHKIIKMFHK